MEEPGLITTFEVFAEHVAVAAEFVATLLIVVGIVDATVRIALGFGGWRTSVRPLKHVWLRLAGWILLALEFTLAADIVRTSANPDWEEVGKLAAVATIRTALSIFLERDLTSLEREEAARQD
jgi:uncharacterized membrane protein